MLNYCQCLSRVNPQGRYMCKQVDRGLTRYAALPRPISIALPSLLDRRARVRALAAWLTCICTTTLGVVALKAGRGSADSAVPARIGKRRLGHSCRPGNRPGRHRGDGRAVGRKLDAGGQLKSGHRMPTCLDGAVVGGHISQFEGRDDDTRLIAKSRLMCV